MTRLAAAPHGAELPVDLRPVCAVIVHFGMTADLTRCVETFDAQDLAPDELRIVVVDNATPRARETLARIGARTWTHPVEVIANTVNRGYAGAINDVLAHDAAPVVVFANVDVAPATDAIRRAVEVLAADPVCGSVQPLLLASSTVDRVDTTGHVLTRARIVRNRDEGRPWRDAWRVGDGVFGVSGAFAVHRRSMLDDVRWRVAATGAAGQVLSEDLFAFFEDVELDWRARRRGWSARFAPESRVVHERGGRGARRSAVVEELNWANRLLVMATCDDVRDLRRHAVSVACTTLAQSVLLGLRRPRTLLRAVGRLRRGLPAARRRRLELERRACRSAAAVIDEWAEPLPWRSWLATRLVTGWRAGRGTG